MVANSKNTSGETSQKSQKQTGFGFMVSWMQVWVGGCEGKVTIASELKCDSITLGFQLPGGLHDSYLYILQL